MRISEVTICTGALYQRVDRKVHARTHTQTHTFQSFIEHNRQAVTDCYGDKLLNTCWDIEKEKCKDI